MTSTQAAQTEQQAVAALLPDLKGALSKKDKSNLIPSVKPSKENEFPKEISANFVKKFMPWFEEFWHSKKRYPSSADIATKFGWSIDQITLLNNSTYWRICCRRRGIADPVAPNELTDRQIAAIAVMTNFTDRRPIEARLTEIGVRHEELQGWMSNGLFKQRLEERSADVFDNLAPVAKVSFARSVEKGDFRAIKFFYEITGQANSPEAVNARRLVQTLIEAVQKHVKDPEILEAIAREVQSVNTIQAIASQPNGASSGN